MQSTRNEARTCSADFQAEKKNTWRRRKKWSGRQEHKLAYDKCMSKKYMTRNQKDQENHRTNLKKVQWYNEMMTTRVLK